MAVDRRQALFRDLQPLGVPTRGKPDPHENLTDILEILAVAEGIKPAHLQGQGQHDAARLGEVERVAGRHGLRTIRTQSILPFFHRRPDIDPVIADGERADALERQRTSETVVWVYADDVLPGRIAEVVAGRSPVSNVLGYPACCVSRDSESKVLMMEAYVRGIINTYGTTDPNEILRMWREDVGVQIDVDEREEITLSRAGLRQFPYLQLQPCRPCVENEDSPAARLNRQMRDFAFRISLAFGRDIWKARDQVTYRGRRVEVGRNDLCPCGSGAKFKRCCL